MRLDDRRLPEPVTGYRTLQFHVGGLFDSRVVERRIHLVRRTRRGTPGPTLCGLDRFRPDSPGWSVGGGISGDYMPCPECAAAAEPLPVDGMFAALFAATTRSGGQAVTPSASERVVAALSDCLTARALREVDMHLACELGDDEAAREFRRLTGKDTEDPS